MPLKPDDPITFQRSRRAKCVTVGPMSVPPDVSTRSVVGLIMHERDGEGLPLAYTLDSAEEVETLIGSLRQAQTRVFGPSRWGAFG